MQAGIAAEPYLHDFARLLARAPDRGPVKFGIALLGVIGDPQDTALVNTLGKHDEFTLFSTVALMNIVNSPERALFELAKCVEGWGRIHLVERLANTEDADIKNWLIRHGYKNSITVEYLAYTCAQAGELHVALREARVDQELLDTSGDIIEALIMGGPVRDMDDYEKAADVIEHYLRHLRQRPASVKHFLVLQAIQGYLEDDEWDPAQRIENGWLPGRREGVLATVAELLDDDIWQQLAHSQLSSQDEAEFHQAERAADILGIETWSVHWQRLQDMPSEPGRWHFVMRKANADNIDAILSFAERVLPLEEIASGPSEALALGPEYRWHSCLDFVLQDL
ncbi:MAG: hypothetical protein R3300_08480, partial [Candidatus Promineifilaceae bacterium]|nr:hypothetical protein [Candidatus Promineifilaceae bacterium]